MKTLVIHPKDSTTDFLSKIYLGKNWDVIYTNISKSLLKKKIKENDKIIMLGHGCADGLFGFNRLFINSEFVYLLRERICICIWCNADLFVEKYKLKGFYTGMIISEYEEAIDYGVSTDAISIKESNEKFSLAIKKSIDKENMLESVKRIYNGDSSIINFNQQHIYSNYTNFKH